MQEKSKMASFSVTVSFVFELEAADAEEAEKIADSAFTSYVDNPQTGKRIKPIMDADEQWWLDDKK